MIWYNKCMFEIRKENTACFTGHRILPSNDSAIKKKIEKEIRILINQGITTYLCGMAIGFDMLAAEVILKLRNEFPNLKLVAVIPCLNQNAKFSIKDKTRYKHIIKNSEKIIIIAQEYYNGCMQKRNRFLVDYSTKVLAYLNSSRGGTFYTVNYAVKNDIEVIDCVNR